jgi:hypothetical protein
MPSRVDYQQYSPAKACTYLGRLYRTKSEAKWAAVFTLLRVPFYYEQARIMLPAGEYLPDFWLPTLHAYFEVKPHDVTDPRHWQLGRLDGVRVFVGASNLPQVPRHQSLADLYRAMGPHIWQKHPRDPRPFMLARERSGHINIVPMQASSMVRGDDPDILEAYAIASGVKFREVTI